MDILCMDMKNKIIVVGCPGSGKSTFSRELSEKTGIEVYHLDNLYWNSDKTTVDAEEFDRRLWEIMKKDSWIIDGNFSRTMEIRLKEADAVYFFDLPVEVCLESVRKRIGTIRVDIPWVEEEEDEEFMEYIRNFPHTHIPRMKELFGKYPQKQYIVFKTREESEKYLRSLIGAEGK